MNTPSLEILAVTDLHFVGTAQRVCPHPARRTRLAHTLLRKAWLRLQHLGCRPDVVVLLGDALDDGDAPEAARDLEALAEAAKAFGVPLVSVRGNHDGDAATYERILGTKPGLHVINGVGLLVFNDRVGAGDVTTRAGADLGALDEAVRANPGMPLVVLQHNPIFPRIEADYPYMLTNGDAVLEAYARSRVVVSLSGHYHAGQGPAVRDGVTYYTVPALCEAPFRFAQVSVRGREVQVREHALRLDTPGLTDVHCHTEYAYCGTTVSADKDMELSQALGVGQLCLTEHSFQLYFEAKEAWAFGWQTDLARVEQAWRGREGRMDAYRAFAAARRGPGVRLGLEVDLLADGRLLLAPDDRPGWDLLVGAVHGIHDHRKGITSPAETEALFMRDTEALLRQKVTVLAHPFRFFRRLGMDVPRHLYPRLADLLAEHGVAAEINYHINREDPDFIRECVRRGVRIALGSDSHDVTEVGELVPHLQTLAAAGVAPSDYARVLLRLP